MSFESEFLIARFRSRGVRLIVPTVFLGLAAFLLTFFSGWPKETWQFYLLFGGCAAIAIFGFLVPLIRYLTSWTDITTARVVVRSGLWGQNYRSVAIADISDIKRLPGGPITILVENEEDLELRGLPKPRLIIQELIRLKQSISFTPELQGD